MSERVGWNGPQFQKERFAHRKPGGDERLDTGTLPSSAGKNAGRGVQWNQRLYRARKALFGRRGGNCRGIYSYWETSHTKADQHKQNNQLVAGLVIS